MENLPRNLEKNVGDFTPPKPSKKKRGWTLLFIDGYGKTRHIRWFRAAAFLWVFFLALAAATSACLYFLYKLETEQNRYLTLTLERSRQRVTVLAAENEALRLRAESLKSFIAEEVAKAEAAAEDEPTDAEEAEADSLSDAIPESDGTLAASGESAEGPSEDEATDEAAESEAAPEEMPEEAPPPPEPEKPLRIDAENFSASYKKYRKTLNVRLDIRNVTPESDRVAGHVFVVLKSESLPEKQWVTMPPTDLVSGKPSGEETGNTFAISRFKTLKFQAKIQNDPDRFETATVFIFDMDGSLMLEKDFPITEQ